VIVSFDTNLLVYAVDEKAGARHDRAADLVERAMRRGACIQTLQSFCELFHVLTRKLKVTPPRAEALVESWMALLPVEPIGLPDIAQAMRAAREHKLQFWDAMIWATARRVGVGCLFSEDLQDGRSLEGVRFIDPFAAHNAALIETVLMPLERQ
jgi:predicted nucleic acid-binding protein